MPINQRLKIGIIFEFFGRGGFFAEKLVDRQKGSQIRYRRLNDPIRIFKFRKTFKFNLPDNFNQICQIMMNEFRTQISKNKKVLLNCEKSKPETLTVLGIFYK